MPVSFLPDLQIISVDEVLERAFEYVGLEWSKFVDIDARYFCPTEVGNLVTGATRL